MDVKVRFSDQAAPAVGRGRHQMTLEFWADVPQSRCLSDGTEVIDLMFTRKRFTLSPQEIYSVYPPEGSCGEYHLHLPHIIFERASLPWEYTADGVPALALFVTADGEGCRMQDMNVSNLRDADGTTFVSPALAWDEADADQQDDTCRAVDIPAGLFRKLRVDQVERKLLTHVREVSLKDKVTDPTVRNGVFSGLIANRFPDGPDEGGQEPQRHDAYVVSMWEYDEVDLPAGIRYVRCLCLHHWEFYVNGDPCGFSEAVGRLKAGTLSKEVPGHVGDRGLREVLGRGFLPMDHDLRDGSRTVSWYRGPWIPFEEAVERRAYHVFSDELYYYDPEAGMMDVSYACAWQVGRMIAAHYATTANEILRWRLQNYREAVMEHQRRGILEKLPVREGSLDGSIRATLAAAADRTPDYEEEGTHGDG